MRHSCWGACGISFRCCCRDCCSGGAAFWQLWRSVDRLAHASLGSAALTRGVAAGVRATSAVGAGAVTAASAALPFWQLWRSVDRLAHASLRLSSPHARLGCWGAGGISHGHSCHGCAFSGTASEQLRRSVDRRCTPRFGSAVLTHGVTVGMCAASAMGAFAVATTLAALGPSCSGPPSIATRTHHVRSAVLTHDVAAGALAASALSALVLPPSWWRLPSGFGGVPSPHARKLLPSSCHVQRGGWCACRISRGRCCPRRHLGGGAFARLWHSVDRRVHASLRLCLGAAVRSRRVWLWACVRHPLWALLPWPLW